MSFLSSLDTTRWGPHSSPSTGICQSCVNLDPSNIRQLPTSRNQNRSDTLTIDWTSIKDTSHQCLVCALLVKALRTFCTERDLVRRRVLVNLDPDLRIRVVGHDPVPNQLRKPGFSYTTPSRPQLVFYSPSTTPWTSIPVRRHLPGWTASEQSLYFARNTLAQCQKEHKSCRTSHSTFLPTRILDLGPPDTSMLTKNIRLLEYEGMQALYACLSHCWGVSHRLTTTADNIEAHKKSISIELLPKTFQDAVHFTKRLGIRYLWIDSLCIIQGNEDDWTREAARMSDIYGNCFVCLAATDSRSDDGGCYTYEPMRRECFESNAFGHLTKDTPSWEVYVREIVYHESLHELVQFDWSTPYDISDEPGILRTRGWVYQERILSPRVIHFLNRELVIECRTSRACECCGQYDDSALGTPKPNFVNALESSDRIKLRSWWHRMVEHYSTLKLTFDTDRLPAIAGIATQFQKVRKCFYFAGIWEDSAIEDLAWEAMNPGSGPAYARVDGVPTWSWASVTTVISYDVIFKDRSEAVCDVLEIESPGVILNRRQETNALQKLTLRGYMISAILDYEGDGRHCYLKIPGFQTLLVLGNDVALGIPGPSFVAVSETLHCIWMLRNHTLILQQLDVGSASYRRVGICTHIRGPQSYEIFEGVSEKTIAHIF